MRNSNKTLLDIPLDLAVLEARISSDLLEEELAYLNNTYEVVNKKDSRTIIKSVKTLIEEKLDESPFERKCPIEILIKYPLLATLRNSERTDWFYFLLSKGGYF